MKKDESVDMHGWITYLGAEDDRSMVQEEREAAGQALPAWRLRCHSSPPAQPPRRPKAAVLEVTRRPSPTAHIPEHRLS